MRSETRCPVCERWNCKTGIVRCFCGSVYENTKKTDFKSIVKGGD